MARPRPIRVMISSRAEVKVFDGGLLSDCRRRIKDALESELLFGEQLFETWIHEDARAAPADAWEESLKQVSLADVVLVLYNGQAGWAVEEGDIGICHAELREALRSAPGKVYMVPLEPLAALGKGADRKRDERFRAYVERENLFHGPKATSLEEAVESCGRTLREAVAQLAHLGVREAGKGRYAWGESLDWSRLDFVRRKEAIEESARTALVERGGSPHDDGVVLPLGGEQVLLVCHAVPAAMSVAAAREMVGQPFLDDHTYLESLAGDVVGPVHLIAAHRNVTETQATKQLGFPDATIISAPFGVYVADDIQKIQLIFIRNCRDDTETRHGVQRLFEWLERTNEDRRLGKRAAARERIVEAIRQEL